MEEHAEGRCSVVYYCGGLEEEICELHHCNSLPTTREGGHASGALDVVHSNVHALLDEDQGGLDEGRIICASYRHHALTTAQSS